MKERTNRAALLKRGREALQKFAWKTAFTHLSTADRVSPLVGADLEGLAVAAYLSGHDRDGFELLARAHQTFAAEGNIQKSAHCAFWLAFISLNTGEEAQASGWLARAVRMLAGQKECVEHGYLRLPEGIRAVRGGDVASAEAAFTKAIEIGERFGDKELVTLALQGRGRVLVRAGNPSQGLPLIDEAMVAVLAGEVSPIVAGAVYCSVLDCCREAFDVRRAKEWTAALTQWCAAQPEMVPHRGNCQLHRAEVLQLRGDWSQALTEARLARASLSEHSPKPALGSAVYRVAELCRMRGEFAAAEEAYAQASHLGYTTLPGLALLRLVQGQTAAAMASVRRLAEEVKTLPERADILCAFVEIALAANDIASAQAAAEEFMRLACGHGAALLAARASCAMGAVLLAQGKPREALTLLRQGWSEWCELDAPYEAARARVCIGMACREQGDHDAASLEFAAARKSFEALGAKSDLERLERRAGFPSVEPASPLTSRELEVLQFVAAGITNRGIATTLRISEKTVARHISNIFIKLDLNSRSAATAYAFQHGLVGTRSTQKYP